MSPERLAVLAAARALLPVREEPRNANDGQMVRAMLASVGAKPGDPWCAAFVSFVGRAALGARWPLPATAGCAVLGDAAIKRGWLVSEPMPGDVFLVWFPALGRFAHTGFVTESHPAPSSSQTRSTIEGNTAANSGTREGWGVFERVRSWNSQDRFIRWSGIDPAS